jgi:hypothetical protein
MPEESAIPDTTIDIPPHRKRWVPLSLRLFLTILAIVGVGGSLWIGIPAFRQHTAIQHFRGLGVELDIESSPFLPEWVFRWVGDPRLEPFGTVRRVNLSGFDIAETDVVYLQRLNGLEWLALNRSSITDSGILHVASIGNLRALRIEDTQVTDSGLVHLQKLKRLEVLSLKRTSVTGSGVKHLAGIPKLRHLDLTGTLVDDNALADLKGLNHIRELRLGDTLISEDGLEHLHAFTTLNRVVLGDLDVSPTAVASLQAAIPGLEVWYEWNCTLQNINGEPTLDTNWAEIVFEGGKYTHEISWKSTSFRAHQIGVRMGSELQIHLGWGARTVSLGRIYVDS